MGTFLFAVPMSPIWAWVIGFVVLALLLTLVGRSASRTSVAGEIPPLQGPDVKATEKGQTPDIASDDRNQNPLQPSSNGGEPPEIDGSST